MVGPPMTELYGHAGLIARMKSHPGEFMPDPRPAAVFAEPPPPPPPPPVQQQWVPDKPLAYFEDVELLCRCVRQLQAAATAQQDRLADQHKATVVLETRLADLHKASVAKDERIAELHLAIGEKDQRIDDLELKIAQIEYADVAGMRKQIEALEAKATEPETAFADIAELRRATAAMEMRYTDAATSAVAVVNEKTGPIWGAVNELRAKSEEQAKRLDDAPPPMLDQGVYKPDTTYRQNSLCSHGGGLWLASRDTSAEPGGEDSGWRLAAKQGKRGAGAYDLVKKHGYRGTEIEFANALIEAAKPRSATLHLPSRTP
jgi:hypothetical protein